MFQLLTITDQSIVVLVEVLTLLITLVVHKALFAQSPVAPWKTSEQPFVVVPQRTFEVSESRSSPVVIGAVTFMVEGDIELIYDIITMTLALA